MSLRSRLLFLVVGVAAVAAATGYVLVRPRVPAAPADTAARTPAGHPQEWFVDRAAETGLDFVHFNGMSGQQFYAEHMGPGVAVFDFDNDGDLDVLIPQGQMLGAGRTLNQALFPPKDGVPPKGRLFRNDLQVRP